MGPGTLTHFNRQAFEERAAKNAFFNFSEAADGSFDFVRADVEAKLDRGLAELTKAEIEEILGRSTTDLPADMQRPVVHADDLVAL